MLHDGNWRNIADTEIDMKAVRKLRTMYNSMTFKVPDVEDMPDALIANLVRTGQLCDSCKTRKEESVIADVLFVIGAAALFAATVVNLVSRLGGLR